MPHDDFVKILAASHQAGLQLFIHATGDGAINQTIRAVEAAGMKAGDDSRTIVIHSLLQHPEEVGYGCRPKGHEPQPLQRHAARSVLRVVDLGGADDPIGLRARAGAAHRHLPGTPGADHQRGEGVPRGVAGGSIAPGTLADIVTVSADPLKTADDQLRDLQVIETIKEGKAIYQRR